MEKFRLATPWEETREKLKEIESYLTDEDLEYVPGQEADLLKKLAAILQKEETAIRAWIESVSANKSIAS